MNDILRAPFETECLQLYRHQRKHIAANLFYHFNPCSRLLLAIQADTPNVPNGQHGKSLFKSLMAFGEFQWAQSKWMRLQMGWMHGIFVWAFSWILCLSAVRNLHKPIILILCYHKLVVLIQWFNCSGRRA